MYEDRLKGMGLPTLQNRKERGDLITLYKILNGIKKLDKQYLVMRGHSKDFKSTVFHIELWIFGTD